MLFLLLLFTLSSCTRNVPIDSINSNIDNPKVEKPKKETVPATQQGIDSPQTSDTEEVTEPTKNPEQMLNDILRELDELEQLMDGT